jgi:hypothetical protein
MDPRARARIVCYILDVLLAVSFAVLCGALLWEFSTEQYLSGFADAIVPEGDTTSQKVESILHWMSNGPARVSNSDPDQLLNRDPRETLNYSKLLKDCGSATNAFVNLARRSGIHARRLLLLDSNGSVTHVVAEARIDGRWIVVDAVFHFVARDSSGRLLSREDLQDPEMLRQATAGIPNYSPLYTYNSTEHIRLARIALIGAMLQRAISQVTPAGGPSWDWTLPLERESFAALLFAVFVFMSVFVIRKLYRSRAICRLAAAADAYRQNLTRTGASVVVHNE